VNVRRFAAVLALLGGAVWLSQTLILVARGGKTPDPSLEELTFLSGLLVLGAAAVLIAWALTTPMSLPARAVVVVLSLLAIPVALFIGQVVAFSLPGSPWFESDIVVFVIALVALGWGITDLRRQH